MNANTIKAEVKKQFTGVKVTGITKHKFGMFSVAVSEQKAKSVRKGLLMGETDFDKSANGVVLDAKIQWL